MKPHFCKGMPFCQTIEKFQKPWVMWFIQQAFESRDATLKATVSMDWASSLMED
jgi:hypothetical protein